MPLTVKASDARAQFPSIAKRVHEDNIEVTVIKGSKPYVKIVPIDHRAESESRRLGTEDASAYFASYQEAVEEYRDLFEALSK